MSRSILFTLAALASVSASASSPLLLPGGPATLPSGSAEETRKSLVAVGKSLAEDSSTDVWIVQYDPEKTMASAIRRLVAAAGAKILSPVSGGAYLVRATKAQQLAILESGQIEATRPYVPEDKGAPVPPSEGVKSLLGGAAPDEENIYVVSAFSDASLDSLRGKLSALDGCEVLDAARNSVRVRMTPGGYVRAVSLPEIESVGEWLEPELDNDLAVKRMRVDTIWPSRQSPEGTGQTMIREGNASATPKEVSARRAVVDDLFTKGLLTPLGEEVSPPADALQSGSFRTFSASSERDGGLQTSEKGSPLSLDLTGKGQIVAVCDSGLDTGNLATIHPDVRGRVVKTFAYARPGDWSDLNGHGTHVAGSVLGNGTASGGKIRGVAYEAELLFQSCGADSGSGLSTPDSIYDDAYGFRTSDGRSPRIHSDSWGTHAKGAYTQDSQIFDVASFVCPDFLMVTSAGNDGADAEVPFGVVDPGSIGAPATAKNCISVGNAENIRMSGGKAGTRYVEWGTRDKQGRFIPGFAHEPIASDFLTSGPKGHENLLGMAAGSSRGPCRDGRIKPDVVAPGQQVVSMRSSVGKIPDANNAFSERYRYMDGTSMACPLVAGTAALVRQWLVERKGVPDPDAATMKALICAGAKSLAPGQYGTGEFQEIPFSYPNNVEGWGMVDLENTVANPDGVAFRDGEVVAEGEAATFRVSVPGGRPLCILMAYSDAPATSFSGGLVNDLDMTVVDPSGKTWYPNSKNGPDRENNVEGVRWANAPAGEYAVSIRARSIQKPMDVKITHGRADATRFSLVANGAKAIR